MSQNRPTGGSTEGNYASQGTGTSETGTGRATTAGTPSTGTGGSSSQGLTPSTSGATTGGGQTGTGAATGLAATAKEYGDKIAGAATTAKDYVSDKVSVVGDKIKDLQNVDIGEVATQAKDYARQNPGQAILISAAAGFVLGLLIRGSRR